MGSLTRTGQVERHVSVNFNIMVFFKELTFIVLVTLKTVTSQNCCPTKTVAGVAAFLPICMDQCAYKRIGNADPNELFCFKTQGATHNTQCTGGATTVAAPAGGSGTCPYTKDNVSWGEYQTKIGMPAGASSPYTVVITFDTVTTIGSCHSNCNDGSGQNKPSCAGKVCTVEYTGTIPLNMFNIKKANPSGETDRSNMVSVTVNDVEQC